MQINNSTNGFVSLNNNKAKAETSLEKMAKGVNDKINEAALRSIAGVLNSQASSLTQGVANANDNVALLQIADGALSSVSDDTQRLNELSVKMNSASLNSEQKSALSSEFTKLTANIADTLSNTSYNGQSVFSREFETSLGDGSTFTTNIASPNASELTINSQDSIKAFMSQVSDIRANLGSSSNALQSSVNVQLQNIINTTEAASNMIDIDYAKEANEFKNTDLLLNASTIAQAHKTESLQSKMQMLLG